MLIWVAFEPTFKYQLNFLNFAFLRYFKDNFEIRNAYVETNKELIRLCWAYAET